MVSNLQIVKQDLSGVTEIELKTTISETIDMLCKTNKTYLQRKINEATKEDFLDKNKILYNYIK